MPEPHEIDVPDGLRHTIEDAMATYPDRHSAVLPALMAAQELHGWLSPAVMLQVASVMRVTPAYLESVATFYDMFELEPAGKRTIYVCTNISCSLRGARELLDAFSEATGAPVNGASADGEFQLRGFECMGACDGAPMASIEGQYRGPLTAGDAREAADKLRAGRPPEDLLPEKRFVGDDGRRNGAAVPSEHPDSAAKRPSIPPEDPDFAAKRNPVLFEHIDEPGLRGIATYERLGGYRGLRKALTEMDADLVLRELEASGLRGRGGAGFSMGKKASFLPKGAMDKYLCCNADESEPGAFKDRELMFKNPHGLVEGIAI
jgi:NADH:ubiquinone oxidoreductase subunit E